MKEVILPALRVTPSDYASIEAAIMKVLTREMYAPLMRAIAGKKKKLKNDNATPLIKAIRDRTIVFYRGVFSGTFDSKISKELRALGATWDKRSKVFRLHTSKLPMEIRSEVFASYGYFQKKMEKVEKVLTQILPAKIAEKINVTDIFEKELWKVDQSVEKTLQNIAVTPRLTPERAQKIAMEWQENLERSIKGFTEARTKKLREEVLAHAFSGGRYDTLIERIQKEYGIAERRAKFIARQETSLLMNKFKETRYVEAGSSEYDWQCVIGSPKHPVRPRHKELNGTRQRWDSPPVTTEPGQPQRRNHPGEDYNCRCTARPVVRLKA